MTKKSFVVILLLLILTLEVSLLLELDSELKKRLLFLIGSVSHCMHTLQTKPIR